MNSVVPSCACGCEGALEPGRRYLPGHSLRGPKSPEHRAAIAAALIAFHERERPGERPGKVCSKCGEFKGPDEFGFRSTKKTNTAGKPYLRSECRACTSEHRKQHPRKWKKPPHEAYRRHHLRWRYGMTPEDYDRMLAAQGGGCGICGTSEPGGSRERYFHVDHCHATGRVRGLLCTNCNKALGHMGDDPGRLRAAIIYLGRSGAA